MRIREILAHIRVSLGILLVLAFVFASQLWDELWRKEVD